MEQPKKSPRYLEIAADLQAAIESGEILPGQPLPSEMALVARYDVSKMTARNALTALVHQGLVEAQHGRGFFVRSFRPIRRVATKRLREEIWGGGHSMWSLDTEDRPLETRDVQVDEVEPPSWVAADLGAGSGVDVVLRRSRLYVVDEIPVMSAVSYLPLDIVAGTRIAQVDTGPGGIYARLKDLGHGPVRYREQSRSRMPTPAERELLALPGGTPVTLLVRTAMDASGRVVEVNDMILDASRFVLVYDFPAS